MKSFQLGWKSALVVIGLAVLFLLIMDFNRRTAELNQLTAEKERVGAQATQLVRTRDAVQAQIATATSNSAVATVERGKMNVQDGDILIVPMAPPDSTPAMTPTVVVTPVVVTHWEMWLALFLGQPGALVVP